MGACYCTGKCRQTGYCPVTQPGPFTSPSGWVCPKCGSVMAPFMPNCTRCPTVTTTNVTVTNVT